MEYRTIKNLLDNTPNQLSAFKTKTWVKINDESRGTYNEDNQIKFKISMLRPSLCNYSDAYILAKGPATIKSTAAQGQTNNEVNTKMIFKNCAPFAKCKQNKQYASRWCQYIDEVMPIYNLIL